MAIHWMYALCGVIPPGDDVDKLQQLVADWKVVSTAASLVAGQATRGVTQILADNDGPAADAFKDANSGPTSAPEGLRLLAEAATRTAELHNIAALTRAHARLAMDGMVSTAGVEFMEWAHVPMVGVVMQARVVASTRTQLLVTQATVTAALTAAYAALGLPAPLVSTTDADQARGTLSPELEAAWASLSEADKRKVLQAIVDEQARAAGMEPVTIQWDEADPNNGSWHPDGTLHMNPNNLNNPQLMHTAAHEMRHGAQFKMIDQYNSLSADDITAINEGRMADPFRQYGSNLAEVERFSKNDGTDYKAPAAGYDDYFYQPLERDARDTGTQFLDGLTPAKLAGYLN